MPEHSPIESMVSSDARAGETLSEISTTVAVSRPLSFLLVFMAASCQERLEWLYGKDNRLENFERCFALVRECGVERLPHFNERQLSLPECILRFLPREDAEQIFIACEERFVGYFLACLASLHQSLDTALEGDRERDPAVLSRLLATTRLSESGHVSGDCFTP